MGASGDDIAIALKFAPYSRLTFSVAASVFKAGGDVIAITDHACAPVAALAT